VINNLEYDHADIFPDLAAIETQFHHLVRCIPDEGLIVRGGDVAIDRVLEKGCWTPVETVSGADSPHGTGWAWRALSPATDMLQISAPDGAEASLNWNLIGDHNAANATAAIAAAAHVGISLQVAVQALSQFAGVKRRLELLGRPADVSLYDDFAHHPTAIEGTLRALRAQLATGNLIAVIEPRSNTMRLGEHREALASCAQAADYALWYAPPDLQWDLSSIVSTSGQEVLDTTDALIERALQMAEPGDSIVIMSNGGFDGLHNRLLMALEERARW
jgi:UDP-N-acetylmuramate: L-alanyl-gamma-D-glutamyl-meso-diaminopimelate ligase